MESWCSVIAVLLQAGGRGLLTTSGQRVRDGLLYCLSRTDFLTEEENVGLYRTVIGSYRYRRLLFFDSYFTSIKEECY